MIKSQPTAKAVDLIRQLNPKIRGWANYFRHSASKKTFTYVDHYIFKAVMQWIRRRHPNKSAGWKYNKYFRTQGSRRWIFSAAIKDKQESSSFLDLFRASQIPIRRHVKIKAEATLYDPQFKEYFLKRNCFKKETCPQDQTENSAHFNKSKSINETTGSVLGL